MAYTDRAQAAQVFMAPVAPMAFMAQGTTAYTVPARGALIPPVFMVRATTLDATVYMVGAITRQELPYTAITQPATAMEYMATIAVAATVLRCSVMAAIPPATQA